jgi:hypothetical protein
MMGGNGAPLTRRWRSTAAGRLDVLLDLVDQDHRIADDHAQQRGDAKLGDKPHRRMQQQQRRGRADQAQRAGQEHHHRTREAVQLQHQQREDQEDAQRQLRGDRRPGLAAFLLRPAIVMR